MDWWAAIKHGDSSSRQFISVRPVRNRLGGGAYAGSLLGCRARRPAPLDSVGCTALLGLAVAAVRNVLLSPDMNDLTLVSSSQVPPSPDSSADAGEGMARHLMAAVWLNLRRAPVYARRSRGRSLPVSVGLVISELALLPLAVGFDAWGVLRDEPTSSRFVSMRMTPWIGAPFAVSALAPGVERADRVALRQILGHCRKAARAAVGRRDLVAVAEVAATGLRQLERLESECSGALFPMTRHLLESIGLAAVAGIEDARRQALKKQGAAPSRLALALVSIQLPGLLLGPAFDSVAQRSHRRGVGIIHNDVPSIPFRSRWLALSAA